ncbi:hypothetical protein [Sivoneniella epilithica]
MQQLKVFTKTLQHSRNTTKIEHDERDHAPQKHNLYYMAIPVIIKWILNLVLGWRAS